MRTNPVFSVDLPQQLRHRAEVTGLGCGMLCFAFALFGVTSTTGIIIPIVLSSALASVCVCIFQREDDPAEWVEFIPRAGIRAGLIAGVVGGGVTVLAATFHAFGMGGPSSTSTRLTWFALFLPNARIVQVFIVALMAIPPALFTAVASALVISLVRAESESSRVGNGTVNLAKWSALLSGAMALAILGYLSPLTLWLRPAAPPSGVARPNLPFKEAPAIVATPPTSPPSPKWRYEKPADFDKVEAHMISVVSRSRFGPLDASSPVAISEDGRWLACCRSSNEATLVVYDLDTLEEISVSLPQKPTALAWSPDAKMVLLVGRSDERKLWVFDAEKRRWLLLPKPVDDWLPPGRPVWWRNEEIFFAGYKPRVLDLATLRALKMDKSSRWTRMTEKEKEEVQKPVRLPANVRWEMRMEADVYKYEVPADTTSPWRNQENLRLAFGHPQSSYRSYPPGIDIQKDDVLIAATDGTRVVRIRNDDADIFYFGVGMTTAQRMEITMPASPTDSLSSAITENRVCAFVCAPMINPLNSRTVGPDRTNVKALVRVASWVETAGELWVEEAYRPLQPGDVVADLHLWDKHQSRAAGDFADQEWFAVLSKLEPDSKVKERATVKPLDRAMDVALDDRRDAIRVTNITPRTTGKSETSPPKTSAPSETTSVPTSTVRAPTINVQQERAAIVAFIDDHHGKASRGDVAGLVANYAVRVEFLNHGVVGREYIRRDLSAYHAPGTRTSESLEGTVALKALAIEQVAATYSYSFFHQGLDGKWIRGRADMAMNLQPTTEGWKITEQHVKIRQKQEGP